MDKGFIPEGYISLYDYCVTHRLDIARMMALHYHGNLKLELFGHTVSQNGTVDRPGTLCIREDAAPPEWAARSRWHSLSAIDEALKAAEQAKQEEEARKRARVRKPSNKFFASDISKALQVHPTTASKWLREFGYSINPATGKSFHGYSKEQYDSILAELPGKLTEKKEANKRARYRRINPYIQSSSMIIYTLAKLMKEIRVGNIKAKKLIEATCGAPYDKARGLTKEEFQKVAARHVRSKKVRVYPKAPKSAVINGVKCVTLDAYAEKLNVSPARIRSLRYRGLLPHAFIARPENYPGVKKAYYIPIDAPCPVRPN